MGCGASQSDASPIRTTDEDSYCLLEDSSFQSQLKAPPAWSECGVESRRGKSHAPASILRQGERFPLPELTQSDAEKLALIYGFSPQSRPSEIVHEAMIAVKSTFKSSVGNLNHKCRDLAAAKGVLLHTLKGERSPRGTSVSGREIRSGFHISPQEIDAQIHKHWAICWGSKPDDSHANRLDFAFHLATLKRCLALLDEQSIHAS